VFDRPCGVDDKATAAYSQPEDSGMRSFNFVVERDPDTATFRKW
jgi:hypothetical protein